MQPRRQQRVRVDVRTLVEWHPMLAQQLLQPALLERGHGFGGATDSLAGDEQLRDGLAADARGETERMRPPRPSI